MARVPLPRDPREVVVDGFTHGGEGVVRIEGKAVFVGGVLPGERVVVHVTDDRKRWARATLDEVVTPSPDRVAPPCPYATDCGGCDLQHAAPDAQRRLKARVVTEQLERLAGLVDPPVEACRAVGPDTGYRTHAQLHADDDGRLGFHRHGSHDVVPIDRCLVLTGEAQSARDEVGDDTGAVEVAVRGQRSGDRAALLTPGPGPLRLPDGELPVALTQPDGSAITLRGETILSETVADVRFRFDTTSFFQVNTGGAEAIVAAVLELAGPVDGALVWDLYAGVGLLALPLARAGAEVVAVEGHAAATRWLEANAADADVTIRVVTEDVRRFVVGDDTGDPPDVVVLDPPRTGAGTDVARTLAERRPGAIVYVACDPAALARDTAALAESGYRLQRVVPLDLFPMTHHVEAVALFVG